MSTVQTRPTGATLNSTEAAAREKSGTASISADSRVAVPIRVMHLVYTLRPGGMEHGVVKIANGLDSTQVTSAICSTTPADPDMCRTVHDSVPVVQLRRRKGNDPTVVWSIYRAIRRYRPHILHTHSWGTLLEGIAAGRMARVPAIVHGEHGTLQLRPRQIKAQAWGWRHADYLLSVSSRLAERMSREVGIPLERIHVIRNGVNLTRFSASSRVAATGTRQHHAVLVGAVGRLVEVKDHASFIDAIGILRSRGLNVEGVIAGDGPLRGALEQQIAHQGLQAAVRLLGHRPDVEAVFRDLDIFVQPSKSEGMSNTILEAMASGLPVVATDVGGADEMILDGTTGALVPPRSPMHLADALEPLIRNDEMRRDMGTAARDRAQAEFSLETMMTRYQMFYCGVGAATRTRA